jgi:hypothetical protein
MARYTNPFIGNRAYGQGQAVNTIDLSQAGSVQFAPNLANLAGNTPYVRRNVVPFLIEAPRFFQYAPDPDLMVRCLKAMIENHTRTIDGLNQQLTVDTAEAPVGGSGERIQTATNVTRAVSNPSHGMWELQGRAISKFVKWWIQYGIGDENTKVPLVVSNGQVRAEDYDATFYGATILYVEPDPTFTDVVSAWLCTNMFPTGTPPWEGSKDAGQLGQNLDINIEFTATTDVSVGTMLFAKQIMQSLNLAGMNPNENPLWLENISADVRKANNGIETQLEEGASQRISY